jgi:PAS domain S-box-containing protein
MQPPTTQVDAPEIHPGVGPVIAEHRGPARYAAAIFLVLVVGGIRYALVPIMGTQAPLLPLLLAVFGAVWLGGRDAGLLATILAALSATFAFTAWPNGTHHMEWGAHLALFLISGLLISLGGHRIQLLNRSQREAVLAAQRAERNAIESEAQLRLIADAMPVLIAYVDRDHRYRFKNRPYDQFFHQGRQSAIGVHVREVMGEEAYQVVRPHIVEALSGRAQRFETSIPYPAGQGGARLVDATYVPDTAADGSVRGFFVFVADVTARKQEQEKLQNTQLRLSLALRAGRAGTFEWDIPADTETWSEELIALHGFTSATFDGSHEAWLERIAPEDRKSIERTVENALANGRVVTEFRIRRHDTGELRWMHGRGEVSYDDAGQPVRMIGINADITELKLAEAALLESGQRLRLLTDNLPALISYIDATGCYRFANATYAAWLGADQGALIGRNVREFLSEEMWAYREPYFKQVLAGERVQFDAPTMHRTLGLRDCSIAYVPDVKADGEVAGFYVLVHDVTEQKRAERALREQERKLQLIYDSSSDSLCLLATEENRFRVVSVNATFLTVAGLAREQVEGRFIEDIVPSAHLSRVTARLRQAVDARNPVVFYETAALGGAGLRYGEVSLIPIAAPDGTVTRVLAAVKDVTEKKKAEEALFEASRRKDEFLAMLAHELRNPLAAIRNVSHVLGNERLEGSAIRRSSELLQRQATQLARLVDDLLDVARITRGAIELQRTLRRLDEVLDAALETVQPLCAVKRQTINLQRASVPLWLLGDVARLTQVFSNLLGNAAKYSPDRSTIDVRIEQELTYAVVRIRDDGVGIDAQVLPHLFELFFQADQSLDRSQGGLGVGLTIVKSLVEMHAGHVEAHSEGIGKGSEFIVRLPLASEDAQNPLTPVPRQTSTARRRILVIEDNADAAQSLAMLLEISGHSVQIARDGPTAFASLEHFDAEVVLLDIGLPGADGYIVAQGIRERFPAPTRRLYALTGYGREEDRALALEAGFDGHLTKPVEPAALLKLIEQAPASDPASVRSTN